MSSVRIGGSNLYRIRPWPGVTIKRAITWDMDSRENPRGYDRGASQDIYESTIRVFDTETHINSLLGVLQNNRETVVLDQFAIPIFAPNIDHTGSITCAVKDYGTRKAAFHATAGDDIYECEMTLRAIQPTKLATTPSISALRVQEGADAGHSWGVARAYTQSGLHAYVDSGNDAGRYTPSFVCNTATAQAALAYFLVTARAATFTMPAFGPDYPFGPSRGTGPFTVRLYDFSISRVNLNRWRLDCDFREIG